MKDDQIRLRVSADEKKKIEDDAEAGQFPNVTAYLLTLAGIRKVPRVKRVR